MSSKTGPICPGALLPGGYRLIESIGKGKFFVSLYFLSSPKAPLSLVIIGSFSEIYSATRESDHRIVAVKIQGPDFDSAVLRWEGTVMQAMAHTRHVPQFITAGQYEKRDYIVMDLMSGEDMAHIRNRIRSASTDGLVPLPMVVYLCKQMLTCIESLHIHGFVHRDVKPSNFMQKRAEDTKFCVIDFGLVKQVCMLS